MNPPFISLSLAVLALLIPSGVALSWKQLDDREQLASELQKELDRGIRKYDARGVSAAVRFPDGSVWTGVSGISHETVQIRRDMLFAIGSITKNVVAALALKLAEDGALSLDDPLSKWLPDYPNIDSSITIRQLLNHTSGIHMFWSNREIWDDLKRDRTKRWTPEEVLAYVEEPYFRPGQGFRYSNTNYLLVAMILERCSGATLSSQLREAFWKPLKIENAFLSLEEEIPERQAHVFGDNFNGDGSMMDLTFQPRVSHESITYGSGGLFMTAEDLARWCHALFEGDVLDRQSMDEMLEFVEHGFGPRKRGYGLGVERLRKRMSSGERAFGHTGANIGTSVYMVHLPNQHTSIVVMINSFDHKCSGAITKGLITEILRERGEVGIFPYFEFFPLGFVLIGASAFWAAFLVLWIRRKRSSNLARLG
jgi:D-alanyl-D-alanine carboxypeptidase